MRSFILTALILVTPAYAQSDAVTNAFRLCAMFDATNLASEKCSVSGWNSAIEVSIDTSSSEARKLCGMVATHAQQQGMRFDGKWQIRINSPYSGGNQIAFCTLR